MVRRSYRDKWASKAQEIAQKRHGGRLVLEAYRDHCRWAGSEGIECGDLSKADHIAIASMMLLPPSFIRVQGVPLGCICTADTSQRSGNIEPGVEFVRGILTPLQAE